MALIMSGTALIPVPGHGTIKIRLQNKRTGRLEISAPQSLEILDKRARRIDFRRKNKRPEAR